MTYEEVKRIFRTKFLGTCCIDFENGDGTNECESPNTTCEECRIAEAERMILEALEKQIPKKPIEDAEHIGWLIWRCPMCGKEVGRVLEPLQHHCECGQAVDWSEE